MSKLYVGNIPDGAKEKEIQELFQAFGEVEEVALLRGYGFVHFVKSEDASAALNALDDSEFMGSHIQVQFARTKGHGYGRGSGPPRPRPGRERYDRGGADRNFRESYRDGSGSGYRDSGRERRYGAGAGYDETRGRDYRRYYGDEYDRYDYDRYRGSGYDHYPSDHRYYDDRYHERDYYGKYSEYRTDYKARSRSPTGRADYYASKERGSAYYERDPYREDMSSGGGGAYRSRRW